ERLRTYAGVLDSLRPLLGPKLSVRLHAWKGSIVALVLEDTRQAHDPEVAAIISAVLDDDKYSEKAHQAWRLTHPRIIGRMTMALRQRRHKLASKTAVPSLPP